MDNRELALEDFLALSIKDSIEYACIFFNVDYKKSWSKKKMSEALAEGIRKDPLKLFFVLPEEGLRFLSSLFRKKCSMEIDPVKRSYRPRDNAGFLDSLDTLVAFGLIQMDGVPGTSPLVRVTASYEFKKIMTPFLKKEMRQFSESLDMMADLARGLLYYYGVLEFETLIGMMRAQVPAYPEHQCRAVVNMRAPVDGRIRFQEIAGKEYVIGFSSGDLDVEAERDFVENLVRVIEARTDLDYKAFSAAELIEAAYEGFLENREEHELLLEELWDYFILDGSYMDEEGNDLTFLNDTLSDVEDFQFFMDSLMEDVRRTGDVSGVLKVLEDNMDFPTRKVRDEVFAHFRSFTDSLSRYVFKGHSPLEMESMGKGEKGKVIPFRKGSKIGRNDPCPCGSRKKYKNCHGSGQNPLN